MSRLLSHLACLLGALALAAPLGAAESFFGPALDALLAHQPGEVSVILSETGAETPLYSRWNDFERPIPLGSLVKPFTALAYAQAHGRRFPTVECAAASQCWLPSGHGPVGIVAALALSCNTYFRSLSGQLTAADLAAVTPRFGLPPPPDTAPAGSFFGIGNQWPLSPAALLRAYEELARRSADPLTGTILSGLKASAASGTAAGVGRALGATSALAKTGTAPCTHGPSESTSWTADGFALVLYPAAQPRYSLFVRVHGVPGREAANVAGRILRFVTGAAALTSSVDSTREPAR